MPKERATKEPEVWPKKEYPPGRLDFISQTEKLIDAGLWEKTEHQVRHRFGSVRFISYSRPKSEFVDFRLGGKMWKKKRLQKDDVPF